MEDGRINELIAQIRVLTLRIQDVERALDSATPTPRSTRQVEEANLHAFKVGDRIYILNSIKKPAIWDNRKEWRELTARHGTVTKVSGQKVFFITDNGVRTWRKASNLSNASKDE
jgi:hypothetical protein